MKYELVEGRQRRFVTCASFVDNKEYFIYVLIEACDDYGDEINADRNNVTLLLLKAMLMIKVTLKMVLMRKH